MRGYSWTVIPITWRNRRQRRGQVEDSRDGQPVLVHLPCTVWLEKYFSRGDYRKLDEPDAVTGMNVASAPNNNRHPSRMAVARAMCSVRRPWRSRRRRVVFFMFTPRLVLWRGMLVSQRLPFPEVHRAFDTLRQLQNLWEPADTPSNAVLAWRLLFPAIWHYGHLPAVAFLAMPFIGCLLSLWLTAWLTYRRLGDWRQTWMVTALVAALPWFFVSTGWLAYFDSWLMLGLLLVAFVPSRVALALTCVLTPWIDERFVFALPVAVPVRLIALGRIENRAWRDLAIDLAVVALAGTAYPAIRVAVWMRGDPGSTAYVQAHWEELKGVSNWRLFEGLWSGARAGWLMIGARDLFAAQRIGWKWGGLFAAIVIFTAIGAYSSRPICREPW